MLTKKLSCIDQHCSFEFLFLPGRVPHMFFLDKPCKFWKRPSKGKFYQVKCLDVFYTCVCVCNNVCLLLLENEHNVYVSLYERMSMQLLCTVSVCVCVCDRQCVCTCLSVLVYIIIIIYFRAKLICWEWNYHVWTWHYNMWCFIAPSVWNSLPASVQNMPTLS